MSNKTRFFEYQIIGLISGIIVTRLGDEDSALPVAIPLQMRVEATSPRNAIQAAFRWAADHYNLGWGQWAGEPAIESDGSFIEVEQPLPKPKKQRPALCDCGEPATRYATLKVGLVGRDAHYQLCESCYLLETVVNEKMAAGRIGLGLVDYRILQEKETVALGKWIGG